MRLELYSLRFSIYLLSCSSQWSFTVLLYLYKKCWNIFHKLRSSFAGVTYSSSPSSSSSCEFVFKLCSYESSQFAFRKKKLREKCKEMRNAGSWILPWNDIPYFSIPPAHFPWGERHWGTFNPINAWHFPWVDLGLSPDSEELNNSTKNTFLLCSSIRLRLNHSCQCAIAVNNIFILSYFTVPTAVRNILGY